MNGQPDYYAILGVHPQAEDEVIAAAYRALAKKYHPDAGGAASSARFVEVQEAYEVLSDPERRAAYDEAVTFGATEDTQEGGNGSTDASHTECRPSDPAADGLAKRPIKRSDERKSHVGMALTLGLLVIASTVLVVEVAKNTKDRPETETASSVGHVTGSENQQNGSLVEPGAIVGETSEKSITGRVIGDGEVEEPARRKQIYDRVGEDGNSLLPLLPQEEEDQQPDRTRKEDL